MDLLLKGAGVVVTGGSRGIGLDIALSFAREGARIAICGRDSGRLDAVASEIRAMGTECLTVVADLFEAKNCAHVIEEAVRAFGRLDVLVNNASTNIARGGLSTIELSTDDQLLERFLGKTMSAIRCSRAALPHMRRGGGGRIICIGGTSARSVVREGEPPFTGSTLPAGLGNSSVANFAKHLAEEAGPYGVLVNVVHPHLTTTDRYPINIANFAKKYGLSEAEVEADIIKQTPIRRMVRPSDISPLVLLLASPLAGAITGQSIAVDGGAIRAISY